MISENEKMQVSIFLTGVQDSIVQINAREISDLVYSALEQPVEASDESIEKIEQPYLPIIESLEEKCPNRSFAELAVKHLKDRDIMRDFCLEYVEYMRYNGVEEYTRLHPAEVVRSNLLCVAGHYNESTERLWKGILSEVGITYETVFQKL